MNEKLHQNRAKILTIRVTADELGLISDAAREADFDLSKYVRHCLFSAMLDRQGPADVEQEFAVLVKERNALRAREKETLAAIQSFRRLFVDAMQLNLAGKLTIAHLRGLEARRSA